MFTKTPTHVEIGVKPVTGGLRLPGTQEIVFRRKGDDRWHRSGVYFGERPGDAYQAGLEIAKQFPAQIRLLRGRDPASNVAAIGKGFIAHVRNGTTHTRPQE